MKFIFPLLMTGSLFVISSCKSNKTELLEGDLCIRYFDLEHIFSEPDSTLTRIEDEFRRLTEDTLKARYHKFYPRIKYALEKNLFRKPYIWLSTVDNKTERLFLLKPDYEKLKILMGDDLANGNKKIRIRAVVNRYTFSGEVYYETSEYVSMEKVDGFTVFIK